MTEPRKPRLAAFPEALSAPDMGLDVRPRWWRLTRISLSELPVLIRAEVYSIVASAPGLIFAVVIAMAAHFIADQYGGPPILLALLLGASFGFLAEDLRFVAGLDFASKTILGLGVAMLGAKITVGDIAELGWITAIMVISGVAFTILAGIAVGRLLGLRMDHAVLSATAVGVCGTAAALAVSAVLPEHKNRERFTLLTAIAVTVLGTAGMIVYPWLVKLLGLNDSLAGVFMGATIHNVAQAIGAGYMISEAAGESATIVKLMRVAMLAPIVAAVALCFRRHSLDPDRQQPLAPWFLIGFTLLAILSNLDVMSEKLRLGIADASAACIITAIAALGVKTSVKELLRVGARPIAALVAQSFLLVLFAGLWLWLSTAPAA